MREMLKSSGSRILFSLALDAPLVRPPAGFPGPVFHFGRPRPLR
jgi:hypothetical protein